MKKYMILLYLIAFMPAYTFAKFNFSNQKILYTSSDNVGGNVHAADLDNDGFVDVIASDPIEHDLLWFKNNGDGTFSDAKFVSSSVDIISNAYAADMDGDSDMDIIASGAQVTVIYWFKNDGNGTFEKIKLNLKSVPYNITAPPVDFDNDNDLDILASSARLDTLFWIENTDGNATFGAKKIISSDVDYPNSLFAADLDGDMDVDVLSASINDKQIAWFANINNAKEFGAKQIIHTYNNIGSTFVLASDLDNDGDLDILSSNSGDNTVGWNENIDGKGTFGVYQVISSNAGYVLAVFSEDLDNDGDKDVIAGCQSKISMYENIDGKGTFGIEQILTNTVYVVASVYATDLDNDGDLDILSQSMNDKKLAWYENLMIDTPVKERRQTAPKTIQLYPNYPNPFNPETTIKFHLQKSGRVALDICNLSGQKLETLIDCFQNAGEHEITWHPKGLPSGMYFYRLQAGAFSETRKLILQK